MLHLECQCQMINFYIELKIYSFMEINLNFINFCMVIYFIESLPLKIVNIMLIMIVNFFFYYLTFILIKLIHI